MYIYAFMYIRIVLRCNAQNTHVSLLLPKKSCFMFKLFFLGLLRVPRLSRHLSLHHSAALRKPLNQFWWHEFQNISDVIGSETAAFERRAAAVCIEVVHEVRVLQLARFCSRHRNSVAFFWGTRSCLSKGEGI